MYNCEYYYKWSGSFNRIYNKRNDNTHCYHFKCCSPFLSSLKYDTMHQRLNAIVMKAIWNIEKRQGRVTIQELVEEIKRNIGKEYHMGQR